MRDQIVNEKLTKQMAYSWMRSLSFITRPDEETLETFYTILEISISQNPSPHSCLPLRGQRTHPLNSELEWSDEHENGTGNETENESERVRERAC